MEKLSLDDAIAQALGWSQQLAADGSVTRYVAHIKHGPHLETSLFSPKELHAHEPRLLLLLEARIPGTAMEFIGDEVRQNMQYWTGEHLQLPTHFFVGSDSAAPLDDCPMVSIAQIMDISGTLDSTEMVIFLGRRYVEKSELNNTLVTAGLLFDSALIPVDYLESRFPGWRQRRTVGENLDLPAPDFYRYLFNQEGSAVPTMPVNTTLGETLCH